MRTTGQLASRDPRRGADGRLAPVDRGLCSLLRVDLHAMVRLLSGQRLTVADIVGAAESAAPSGAPR